MPDIIQGYVLENVFNADETGLFYRALPKTSMVQKNDTRKGLKTVKERITVLLACSAMGEKLKPLVINRSETPRYLKNMDKKSLPVLYRWNRKSWMTTTIFEEWLRQINNKMKLQGRHILLLLDNCGAHPHLELTNIKLQFLPPNTTSKLQPLDAGIISTVKAIYRKRMLRHLLAEMEETSSASELAKSITILDAIRWLDLAWTGVKASTVRKCFAYCGLEEQDPASSNVEAEEESLPLLEEHYQQLLDGTPWEEFVTMDNSAATVSDSPTNTTDSANTSDQDPPTEDEEEEERTEPEAVINSRQALEQSKVLLAFANQHGGAAVVAAALRLKSEIEDIRVQEKSKSKQKNITDFFPVLPLLLYLIKTIVNFFVCFLPFYTVL